MHKAFSVFHTVFLAIRPKVKLLGLRVSTFQTLSSCFFGETVSFRHDDWRMRGVLNTPCGMALGPSRPWRLLDVLPGVRCWQMKEISFSPRCLDGRTCPGVR